MMVKQNLDSAFFALADPTRRGIVALLSERPRRAGELHAAFPISAPAISRHLRVLREHGVIEDLRLAGDARVRLYGLRTDALEEMRDWLDELGQKWQRALDSFKSHVEGGT
jgi:DNA-binding transcriptional ArsR family regulator